MAKTAAPEADTDVQSEQADESGDTIDNSNMDLMDGGEEEEQDVGETAEDDADAVDGGDADANVDDDAEVADNNDGSGIEVEGSPASGFGGEDGADGDKPGDEEQGEQAGGFGGDGGDKPDDTYVFSLKESFLFWPSLSTFSSSWAVLTTNLFQW